MKKILIANIFLFCSILSLFSTTWIESYGTSTPFDKNYITGFGMQVTRGNRSETLEAVKTQALNDLSKKISVSVSSNTIHNLNETNSGLKESFSRSNKSSSRMVLSRPEYLIETIDNIIYVLAYVKKNDIVRDANESIKLKLNSIVSEIKHCNNLISQEKEIEAVNKLISILPYFSEIENSFSVLTSIGNSGVGVVFNDFNDNNIYEYRDVIELKIFVENKIDEIKNFKSTSLENSLQKAAFILIEQGVNASEILFPAFTYKNTDYSSSFGQYASNKFKNLYYKNSKPDNNKIVIEGTYWDSEDDIELLIDAVTINGEVVGSVSVTFPKISIPKGYSITPKNHKQALVDLKDFNNEALTDGGIYVDFWTNKGRNEDVLIYNEGDELSLFIRVNQPCITQITYILATGEKILLEEGFYIGVDKVNMVVEYPFTFRVAPPFGIERLIITAFSKEPPKPNVSPKIIDGETYMVFDSVGEVVLMTRGLIKKQKGSLKDRTGEAQLAITTMP